MNKLGAEKWFVISPELAYKIGAMAVNSSDPATQQVVKEIKDANR